MVTWTDKVSQWQYDGSEKRIKDMPLSECKTKCEIDKNCMAINYGNSPNTKERCYLVHGGSGNFEQLKGLSHIKVYDTYGIKERLKLKDKAPKECKRFHTGHCYNTLNTYNKINDSNLGFKKDLNREYPLFCDKELQPGSTCKNCNYSEDCKPPSTVTWTKKKPNQTYAGHAYRILSPDDEFTGKITKQYNGCQGQCAIDPDCVAISHGNSNHSASGVCTFI